MTKSQITLAHETCLNEDPRLKCRPINSVNLLLSFASTIAHCTRYESDRDECLFCNFLKELPGVGQNGHIAISAFSNGGKSNPSGKLYFHGSIAHTNPTQSVDVLKGLN